MRHCKILSKENRNDEGSPYSHIQMHSPLYIDSDSPHEQNKDHDPLSLSNEECTNCDAIPYTNNIVQSDAFIDENDEGAEIDSRNDDTAERTAHCMLFCLLVIFLLLIGGSVVCGVEIYNQIQWNILQHTNTSNSSDISNSPSIGTSMMPSLNPSSVPSLVPSKSLSVTPSFNPSYMATFEPSMRPSSFPTSYPSQSPSIEISHQPSTIPSSQSPSNSPSIILPSGYPTYRFDPSKAPSYFPSIHPSPQPSLIPSQSPSILPTFMPSIEESNMPSIKPSIMPSSRPTVSPSGVPSDVPSLIPSLMPTEEIYEWRQLGEPNYGSNLTDQFFGSAISVSADGLTIGVASYKQSRAVVYRWNGTSWEQKGDPIYGPSDDNVIFAWVIQVDDSGDIVAVGSFLYYQRRGIICIVQWNGTNWNGMGDNLIGTDRNDEFGAPFDLSGNGNVLISTSGKGIHPYEWNGTSWIIKGGLIVRESTDYYFGISLSISDDGEMFATRSINSDGVYNVLVYEWNGSSYAIKGSPIFSSVDVEDYFAFGLRVSLASRSKSALFVTTGPLGMDWGRSHGSMIVWNGTDWDKIGDEVWKLNNGDNVEISSDGSYVLCETRRAVIVLKLMGDENNKKWYQHGNSLIDFPWINMGDVRSVRLSFSKNADIAVVGLPDDLDGGYEGNHSGQIRVFNWTKVTQ